MSVQEFYESIGVNYTDVLRRLGSEKFIEKYLKNLKKNVTLTFFFVIMK